MDNQDNKYLRKENFLNKILNKIKKIIFPTNKDIKSIIYKKYIKKLEENPYFFSEYTSEEAHNLIKRELLSDKPLLITRFGSAEMDCLFNSTTIFNKIDKKYDFNDIIFQMKNNTGFFSADKEQLREYASLLLKHIKNIDILGSWLWMEIGFKKELKNAKKIALKDLEPFYSANPWTAVLKGKKVLVIHPFEESIKYQYNRRGLWLRNIEWCPDFELITLKAVQSIAGNKPPEFDNWFQALNFMENSIKKIDFDIAIIGCGAYGMLLGDFVKRIGKKAIVLGGATQLLFGIKGKRWENRDFYNKNVFNEYWIKPLDVDKPQGYERVENGCYW